MIYKDTDLAWAAGIIDGEGHMRMTNKNYHGCSVLEVYQAGSENEIPEMLLRLKNIFKAGTIIKNATRNETTRKQTYTYNVYGAIAAEIVLALWPYLGTIKRQQAIKAGFIAPPKQCYQAVDWNSG